MQRFKFTLRTALLLILVLGAALAAFRCQILVFADDLIGTELTPKLTIIDSDSDLVNALKNTNCILVVSHEWSIEDAIIRKELSDEIACGRRLGRFNVFLITPTDPTADNGESDAMYARLDKLCNANGNLPKFHWFHNSAGFVFIKSNDKIEWKPHVGTFANLKTLAHNHLLNDA